MYPNTSYSQTGGNPTQQPMTGAVGGIAPQQIYHPSAQMNQYPPTQGQFMPQSASPQVQLQQQHQTQMPKDESMLTIKRLDSINLFISKISQGLIQYFEELTKDRQAQAKIRQAKTIFEEALKNLKKVETDLLTEIGHLNMASTGHPHEGSIYGARKEFDLTKMQVQLISSQLNSLHQSLDEPLRKDFFDVREDYENYDENESDENNQRSKFNQHEN
jgi:hypothetical protein